MKWYAGSDHAGLPLKRALLAQLRALGDEVIDIGTDNETSVDYPEFGAEVGRRVVADNGTLGLVVCGSGIGISIAANKVPGVRAALVHDAFTAEMARRHNDANVVAMGARVVGVGVAEHALATFRSTAFEGGRHQRRVDQLNELGGALDAVRALDRGGT
ncbi:MAG: ribose 5-phosphate isomerase B [Kofleriaceae bacterium]